MQALDPNADYYVGIGHPARHVAHATAARDATPANTIGKHLQIFVRDNNVDQALRVLKKKMQREGVFREMKRRRAYEKPSDMSGGIARKQKRSDERGRLPENRLSARG